MLTFGTMPHEEARARIAELPLLTRDEFEQLLPELRAHAFTITGLDAFDQLRRVRDELAAVPAGSATWQQAKQRIADELSERLGGGEATTRAELLLRTHTFRGYAVARYRTLMAQRDVFPYWQYKTHGDGHVRPSHAALNGKVLPAGHPLWQRIFPPWDWGCRCLVVPLLGNDAQAMIDGDAGKAPEAMQVWHGTVADAIHAGERLPNGISLLPAPTWAGSPWVEPGTIRYTWPAIRQRYANDPTVLAAFETWAAKHEIESGFTVADWLSGAGAVQRARLFSAKRAPSMAEVAAVQARLKRVDAVPLSGLIRSVKGALKTGPLSRQQILNQFDHIAEILPPALVRKMGGITVQVRGAAEMRGVAGTFNEETRVLALHADLANSPGELALTTAHETMHWAWPALSRPQQERVRSHLAKHATGKPTFLRRGVLYHGSEFIHELAGRADGTEVIPYYFERLFGSQADLAEMLQSSLHRESLNLVAEVLGLGGQ
jgi:SPP1 gp7 family putative phage head morphogenesis protein